jgi:hypothetical protein
VDSEHDVTGLRVRTWAYKHIVAVEDVTLNHGVAAHEQGVLLSIAACHVATAQMRAEVEVLAVWLVVEEIQWVAGRNRAPNTHARRPRELNATTGVRLTRQVAELLQHYDVVPHMTWGVDADGAADLADGRRAIMGAQVLFNRAQHLGLHST